ncbi:hypothetical protein AB0J86_36765 [Micromonospora sp. NPDC049559]|uniref:hypothetical protein n=1 Tax=Micromonospora sp. NPDC049559 TaxID=3155923 RepID=UPI00342F3C18
MAALAVVVAGLVTWAVWPSPPPQPLARQYRDVTACLLTDERGITGEQAAPVWAGMQDASLKTLARVQYLKVSGEQTADNARTYLASLVQSRCTLVLAVGAAPVAAVGAGAERFPDARFVTVGGGTAAPNVSVVGESAPEAVRAAASRAVTEAVGPAR